MSGVQVEDLDTVARGVMAKVRDKTEATSIVPGTVEGYDSTENIATVALDGDQGKTTDMINMTGQTLWTDMRVYALFTPPSGVYVVGISDAPGWKAYTPTLTGWTLGDGTIVGSFNVVDDTLDLNVLIIAGPTTVFGNPTISLPSEIEVVRPFASAGVATFRDASDTAYYHGFVRTSSSTTLAVKRTTTDGHDNISQTEPFTWGNGDSLGITYTGIQIQNI